jgi:hypothetical protein
MNNKEIMMKVFLSVSLLLGILLSACPAPQIVDPPDPPTGPEPIEVPVLPAQPAEVHTMLLVGTNELFASHLPLYGAPHDFQIIMRVELDPTSKAALIADQQATGETLYTFFPPEMRLDKLANSLRDGTPFPFLDDQTQQIGSTIFRGHAERGGVPIVPFDSALFTATVALHFRQLNANETDPAEAKYLLFGANDENFVAHLIAGRPDFDQFMEVTAPAGVVVDFVAQEFTVPGQSSAAPLDENQVINTSLFDDNIQLTAGTEHYLEFGDLQ